MNAHGRATMKAAVLVDVNRLEVRDVPRVDPAPHEVLVRVEAVGLNHLDLWVRKGVPGHVFPLPLVPGSDSAGRIDAFGPGAESLLAADGLKAGSSGSGSRCRSSTR